ncbi:MAG: hypothetical protein B6D34_04045 [Candidatus Brocadia sp. UTAMX1]|nr:MAG: hypothetical protein B6D34_04045 [Candidatus Brocadia sp. UTAMX1]
MIIANRYTMVVNPAGGGLVSLFPRYFTPMGLNARVCFFSLYNHVILPGFSRPPVFPIGS